MNYKLVQYSLFHCRSSIKRKTGNLYFLACIVSCLFLMLPAIVHAQEYEILLKGGHVIDPKNGIDAQMDIAVKGDVIARVDREIPESQAHLVSYAGNININSTYIIL